MRSITWTIKGVAAILLVLVGLNAQGQKYYIEVHENLDQMPLQEKPIYLINPKVEYYEYYNEQFNESPLKKADFKGYFTQYLERSARKNDISLKIIKPENIKSSDVSYFNYLGPLKAHIYNLNAIQDHPLNREEGESSGKTRVKNVMVKPPKIHPSYSKLVDIYNTPFFAISGYKVYDVQKLKETSEWLDYFLFDIQSYFYFIIVDVRSGKVIYRETKVFEGKPEKLAMFTQLYDSFNNLKKSL